MAHLRPAAVHLSPAVRLLGATEIRRLADDVGLRPAKARGQNFVIDANTVRRIVRAAGIGADDVVLEVGPGLGSLTLALLAAGARVTAVEIDPRLAAALPDVVAERAPSLAGRLTVVTDDALRIAAVPGPAPSALVANLPYNVAVPVLLHLLERLPSITSGLVMVQSEVADRLAAAPGEPAYGVPSAKLAWYARARRAGSVARTVFWPVPNVDSGLVGFSVRQPPDGPAPRDAVFACIDAAFASRRKTLRAGLARWAGSPAEAEATLRRAGIDPSARAERLSIEQFTALAAARADPRPDPAGPGP